MKVPVFILAIISLLFANELTVAIHDFPPCVIMDEEVSGFDVELFKTLADNLGYEYNFVEVPKFADIIPSISDEKPKYDIGVAGITITDERERRVDFSHPYLNSGLSIMVKNTGSPQMLSVVSNFFVTTAQAWLVFMAFLMVCSILIWLMERGRPSFSDNPVKGIAEGVYWTVTTMTTVGYGDKVPVKPLSRFFAMCVMFVGICVVFPYFVAGMGESMKGEKQTYSISGPRDLRGKKVAVVEGSTSCETVKSFGAKLNKTSSFKESCKLLDEGVVQALVYDTPAIKYYVKENPDFVETGPVFDEQYYGFVFAQGSNMREEFNRELLKVMKSGEYKTLRKKWFGE